MNSAQVAFLDFERPRCWILAWSWNELSSGKKKTRRHRLWTDRSAKAKNDRCIHSGESWKKSFYIHPSTVFMGHLNLFYLPRKSEISKTNRRCLLSKSGWSTLSALHFPLPKLSSQRPKSSSGDPACSSSTLLRPTTPKATCFRRRVNFFGGSGSDGTTFFKFHETYLICTLNFSNF